MARGDGLTIPMADWNDPTPSSALSHFPPGFPIAIATGVKLGMSAVQSARVIEVVAFGATVAIVTYVVCST
ncbi:MAG: hypothetical protein ACM37U_15565, partial [Gemmatimonas sp.]